MFIPLLFQQVSTFDHNSFWKFSKKNEIYCMLLAFILIEIMTILVFVLIQRFVDVE